MCYKSEDKITENSAREFVKRIIKSGHESVLEHFSFSVRFITDRGISHEIVRHRLASYSQESTRYCNYNNKGLEFVLPVQIEYGSAEYNTWESTISHAGENYKFMVGSGITPQTARSVLPNSLKTELIMTANLREWRHFLRLRASKAAHPDLRVLAFALLSELMIIIPDLFDDIHKEVINNG